MASAAAPLPNPPRWRGVFAVASAASWTSNQYRWIGSSNAGLPVEGRRSGGTLGYSDISPASADGIDGCSVRLRPCFGGVGCAAPSGASESPSAWPLASALVIHSASTEAGRAPSGAHPARRGAHLRERTDPTRPTRPVYVGLDAAVPSFGWGPAPTGSATARSSLVGSFGSRHGGSGSIHDHAPRGGLGRTEGQRCTHSSGSVRRVAGPTVARFGVQLTVRPRACGGYHGVAVAARCVSVTRGCHTPVGHHRNREQLLGTRGTPVFARRAVPAEAMSSSQEASTWGRVRVTL